MAVLDILGDGSCKALTDEEAMAVYLNDGKDRERKHVLPTPSRADSDKEVIR